MEVHANGSSSDWIFIPQAHLNVTDSFGHETPSWYRIFYVTACISISVLTVVANVAVFITVLGHRHLRTATNSLLLSLATADLIAGAVMIPFYIDRAITNDPNRIKCLIRKYFFLLTSAASITSLCAVSIDRMIAISYPYFYVRKVNSNVARLTILFVWIFCLTLTAFSFVNWKEWDSILTNCNVGIPTPLYLIVTPAAFYLSGVFILLAYIKIYLIARKHRVQIQTSNEPSVASISVISQSSEVLQIPNQTQRKRTISLGTGRTKKITRSLIRDMKAAKTVSILVGVFLFCWSPTAFFYIYVNSRQVHVIDHPRYLYIHESFQLLSFLNSCLDPILYSLLNKEIRSKMKKLLWVIRSIRH